MDIHYPYRSSYPFVDPYVSIMYGKLVMDPLHGPFSRSVQNVFNFQEIVQNPQIKSMKSIIKFSKPLEISQKPFFKTTIKNSVNLEIFPPRPGNLASRTIVGPFAPPSLTPRNQFKQTGLNTPKQAYRCCTGCERMSETQNKRRQQMNDSGL